MDQPDGSFDIVRDPAGRPLVANEPGIFVSLSHSQASLACAATHVGPIGIDLEVPRPQRDLAGIAAFAFGPKEQIRAAAGPAAFYRIWTLREAIAKATGVGLAQAADRQDRVDGGPETGAWRWQDWHLTHRMPEPGTHLAIALLGPQADAVDWRYFTPNDV